MNQAESLDHTALTFGKYRGATPDQVAAIDPGWLVWAYENIKDKPVCSKLLYDACQEDEAEDSNKFPDIDLYNG